MAHRRRATLREVLLVPKASAIARLMASAEASACESVIVTLTECRLDNCAGANVRSQTTMRRSMITSRLAQLAHQQKAKDGSDEPLPFMRAYQPRKAATEAIPDLKRLWKAQTTEALEQALDQVQTAILDALQSDDIRKRMVAASLMLKTRAARQLGWT